MTQYRSRQEIFDIAYLGLKGQGFVKSTDEVDCCLYRSPDDLKCAIGFLISDEDYHEYLEENVPEFSYQVRAAAKISDNDNKFAAELQDVHDYSKSPDNMQQRLIAFAQEYGLKVPE